MSKSRDQLNEFLREIDIEGKMVLDVGVQNKPTGRLTKGKAKAYFTLDIDPQWNPDIVGDLNEDILSWEEQGNPAEFDLDRSFDVIFAIETLEHLWNPIKAVESFNELLVPGGILYISTPFINPHHDIVDYLRYTNEWFRDVLPKYGFEVLQIKERVATVGIGLLQAFYKTEGLRVSKIRPEHGRYSYPIGYFVKARKIKNA